MPQIFPREFDLIVRLTVLGALLGIAGLIVIWRLSIAAAEGAPIEQPVPFSHKHHVGDLHLDCRYCHASVEHSAYAGMPASAVCMNCHSQLFTDAALLAPVRDSVRDQHALQWNRVYRLPDFVYFDHSIHIGKGVGCVNCHGRVDQMPLTWQAAPLTMQWCLACHRNPAPSLRTQDAVFQPDVPAPSPEQAQALLAAAHLRSTAQLTDCSTCHR